MLIENMIFEIYGKFHPYTATLMGIQTVVREIQKLLLKSKMQLRVIPFLLISLSLLGQLSMPELSEQ